MKYTKILILPSKLHSKKESLWKEYIQEVVIVNDSDGIDIRRLSHLSDLPKQNYLGSTKVQLMQDPVQSYTLLLCMLSTLSSKKRH